MNFIQLTFRDIMQSRIIYFDEKQEDACREICDRLRIDNMPAIDGKNNYKLNNGEFKKISLEKINMVDVNQRIFDEGLLDQFEANDHIEPIEFDGFKK